MTLLGLICHRPPNSQRACLRLQTHGAARGRPAAGCFPRTPRTTVLYRLQRQRDSSMHSTYFCELLRECADANGFSCYFDVHCQPAASVVLCPLVQASRGFENRLNTAEYSRLTKNQDAQHQAAKLRRRSV
ncbi:Hypothetical predicted protein [Cloeon dipterum]|uniref:Uncharacterized protein n=1 Tax=Cloeon dipterum TaxID=197152 RepID=A0A8S1CKN1_9INSE|nr:Hypothetical predicted protein [Cloeon dipterum]